MSSERKYCNFCYQYITEGNPPPSHLKHSNHNSIQHYCSVCNQSIGDFPNPAHIRHIQQESKLREKSVAAAMAKVEAEETKISNKVYVPLNQVPGMCVEEAIARKVAQNKQQK